MSEAISIDQAYVEFAMMMFDRIKVINHHHVQAVAHSELDGTANWHSKTTSNIEDFVDVAARCAILAVDKPSIDLSVNEKDKPND